MRVYAIAIAMLLASAGPAFAEPAKGEAAKPVGPQQRPAGIVLASADSVKAPANETGSAAPAKHRIVPRVTTCRCGDPQVDAATQEKR